MKRIIIFALTGVFLGISGNALGFDTDQIQIHGFVSQGFLKSDENNYLGNSADGSFQFNELGLNFSSELTDDLHIGIQFFSRDLGMIGNNEIIIDWAYADYRWRNWLGFRAGLLRQSHGLYNETRDMDMLRTSILLPQSVYAESGRDYVGRDFISQLQGACVYGEIFTRSVGNFSYLMMAGEKNISNDSSAAKWVEASGAFKTDNVDTGIFYNGSLQWQPPVEGLRLGITGTKSTDLIVNLTSNANGTKLISDIGEYYSYVISAEYKRGNFMIAAEYMNQKKDSELIGMPAPAHKVFPVAYYANASYRFTDWFEIGAYYSEFYYNKDDKHGKNFERISMPDYLAWQKDAALSLRFDIDPYWNFKLEGHSIDGATQLLRQENPDGYEKNWYLFAAKISFSF
jgi:hypothetical protein